MLAYQFTVLDIYIIGFGLIIGSFLNVCIVRLPKDQDIVFKPSHCTACKKPIAWYHNIPVLSYIWLRGKCSKCGARYSLRYLIVELITPILFWTVTVWKHPQAYQAWPFDFYLIGALIVSTFVDIDHWIIPDKITLPGIAVGLASSFFVPDHSLAQALSGMLIGGGILLLINFIYDKWKNIEGIGGGDIKLLAMVGAFLGAKAVIVTIVVSSVLGSFVGIGLILYKGKDFKSAVQFGPFLALGTIFAFFCSDFFFTSYFHLMHPM